MGNQKPKIEGQTTQWPKGKRTNGQTTIYKGTGYDYDGNVFVAWVLQVRRAEVVTK